MNRKLLTRILAGLLALMILLPLIAMAVNAEEMTSVAEISRLEDKPRGTWKNGDTYDMAALEKDEVCTYGDNLLVWILGVASILIMSGVACYGILRKKK